MSIATAVARWLPGPCWLAVLLQSHAWASQPTWTGVELHHLAQARSNPSVIYAAGDGVFKSIDRGQSWRALALPALLRNARVALPEHDEAHVVVWSPTSINGYYESFDSGSTWRARIVPSDPATAEELRARHNRMLGARKMQFGSVWRANTTDGSFRSDDRGRTWLAESTPNAIPQELHRVGQITYGLADDKLMRLLDGESSWEPVHKFEAVNGRARLQNLLAPPDGRLRLRVQGRWRESADQGRSWGEPSGAFGTFANQSIWGRPNCGVQSAPGAPNVWVATCIDDNGALPSVTCIRRSEDYGVTWGPADRGCLNKGLPEGWSPMTLLIDGNDPKIMLATWMAGGLYRTEDAGATWRHSDAGLLFARGIEDTSGWGAVHETPLMQAVMLRDLPTFRRLVIDQKVDINSRGNYVGHVLKADLDVALAEKQQTGISRALYWALRTMGAVPNPERHGFLDLAHRLGAPDIVQDLIDTGYDWGTVSIDQDVRWALSEFYGQAMRESGMAGRPLSQWINAYIKAAKFPSADQTVADLFAVGQPKLALRLLKAASRKVALDRQSTPPSPYRLRLVTALVRGREYGLARSVFLASVGPAREEARSELASELGSACDLSLLRWFVRRGITAEPELECLGRKGLSLANRTAMLEVINRARPLTADDWTSLLDQPETRWVDQTAAFRRSVRVTNFGGVGVSFSTAESCGVTIEWLRPEGPAARAGMSVGDRIYAVHGVSVDCVPDSRVVELMRGRSGTWVELDSRRDEQPMRFLMRRAPLRDLALVER